MCLLEMWQVPNLALPLYQRSENRKDPRTLRRAGVGGGGGAGPHALPPPPSSGARGLSPDQAAAMEDLALAGGVSARASPGSQALRRTASAISSGVCPRDSVISVASARTSLRLLR